MSVARTIVAFLIAPLMTPLVLLGADQLRGAAFNLSEQLGAFVFLSGFAYAATVVFGVPAYFLYRALNWSQVALFILGGAVIGFIVSLFILESIPFAYFIQSLEGRSWFVFAGALSALTFRMILFGLRFNGRSWISAHGET
jgi:hypothetical protein